MSKSPQELARDIVNEQDDDRALEMERALVVQTDNSPRKDDADYGPCNDPDEGMVDPDEEAT